MSSWIRADYVFSRHAARFVIPEEDVFEGLFPVLKNEPDAAEVWLQRLIESKRPDLLNASIEYLSFDPGMRAWVVVVGHPSLPKVHPGDVLNTFHLRAAQDIKELINTTLQDYIKDNKPLLPRKSIRAEADEFVTVK